MTEHNPFLKELQHRANHAHKSTDRADAPPPDTWQRVLAKVQPKSSEEKNEMSTVTLATPATSLSSIPTANRHGVGHYMNLVATITLVVAVAAAGWFATSQLNQPGDPEPRLAILSATPSAEASPEAESATCDVEPLSTDRVMEIVKNPSRFMANGATGEPTENPMTGSPPKAVLWEVDPDLEIVGESTTPSEEQFDEASIVANEYLNCLMYGTQAQIWTFYSPVLLQQKILAEFPVFAEESLVRERVEELSTQPGYQAEYAWLELLSVNTGPLGGPAEFEFDTNLGALSVNSDHKLVRMHRSESSYYENVLSIGISIEDVEGTQIALTNGIGGDVLPRTLGQNPTMIYIQIAKLRSSDGWVIIPWPSESELGWNLY